MFRVIYFKKNEPILFAVEELSRLLEKAGIESCSQLVEDSIDGVLDDHQILLITRERYQSLSIDSKLSVDLTLDGYSIVKQGHNTWIIGEEPRSVLYGVYKYCEMVLGYRWTQLDQEEIVPALLQEQEELSTFNPTFERRGNIIETIDDLSLIHISEPTRPY